MKVVTSKQMAELESLAYNDGSSEEMFMEEAGKGIADAVHAFCESSKIVKHIILLCGRGNNSGDGYVAARYLIKMNYKVFAFQIDELQNCTLLMQKNYSQFVNKGGIVQLIQSVKEIIFPREGVILDGIFGTGFHGIAKEPYVSVIKMANQSGLPILSIDIPSGLNGNTGIVEGPAIQATETLFLGLPKMGFFLQEGWNHVGILRYVNYGLPQSYIDSFDPQMVMLSPDIMKPLLPKIIRSRHKYQAGLVVGLAGSPGMPGAAILSSIASLRGGAGITRLLSPKGMENELSACPPEIIRVPYGPREFDKIVESINSSSACFIGPGFGRTPEAAELLTNILPKIRRPCIIDADALRIIAEEKLTPPKNAILTPHAGELIQLLKLSSPKPSSLEFIKTCQEYAKANRITLVLKGGPSFIFHSNDPIQVNPRGDPGMATAGSGDVLTGLIAALLAQGLPANSAASLGVYLHGVAGESAAKDNTSYCMIASDILAHFPTAFKFKIL
jgi:hydroxyethylthiazole kinase-like uncharacterized protein yjeF